MKSVGLVMLSRSYIVNPLPKKLTSTQFRIIWIDQTITMKVFQEFEHLFDFVAVRNQVEVMKTASNTNTNPDISDQSRINPLTFKHFIPFIVYAYSFAILIIHLFFEAQTFLEFSECIYPIATIILNICNYSVLFANKKRIFKLIDDFETVIQKRKLK